MSVIVTKITVTKMDAARRQLKTALRLWFVDGDPVSIHSLLAASHEIIHRLFRLKGHRGLIFDTDLVKDEYRKEWALSIKKAPSFFKHAEKETADATIDFNPGTNDALPMFLINALRTMGEDLGVEEWAYMRWLWVHEPDLFLSSAYPDTLPVDAIETVRSLEKNEFFKLFEDLWRQGRRPGT